MISSWNLSSEESLLLVVALLTVYVVQFQVFLFWGLQISPTNSQLTLFFRTNAVEMSVEWFEAALVTMKLRVFDKSLSAHILSSFSLIIYKGSRTALLILPNYFW